MMTEMIQSDDLRKAEKRCVHGPSESSPSKKIKLEPIDRDTGTELQSIHVSNEAVTEVGLSDVMSGKTVKETNVIDECNTSDVLHVRLKTTPQKYRTGSTKNFQHNPLLEHSYAQKPKEDEKILICDMSTDDVIIIDDSDLPEVHYPSVTVKNEKTEDTNESSNVVHTVPAAFQQLVVAEVHCSNTGKCECKNTVLELKLEDVSESNQQAEVKVETRQHTIETEIGDVTRGNQADELGVHIPVVKGSLFTQNAMIYKP